MDCYEWSTVSMTGTARSSTRISRRWSPRWRKCEPHKPVVKKHPPLTMLPSERRVDTGERLHRGGPSRPSQGAKLTSLFIYLLLLLGSVHYAILPTCMRSRNIMPSVCRLLRTRNEIWLDRVGGKRDDATQGGYRGVWPHLLVLALRT